MTLLETFYLNNPKLEIELSKFFDEYELKEENVYEIQDNNSISFIVNGSKFEEIIKDDSPESISFIIALTKSGFQAYKYKIGYETIEDGTVLRRRRTFRNYSDILTLSFSEFEKKGSVPKMENPPPPPKIKREEMRELSADEIKKVAHSLGVDLFTMIMSDKKKEKELPQEFYRNYYQTESDFTLNGLVKDELATKQQRMNQNVYFITEKGEKLFRDTIKEKINYCAKKERDIEYLKTKINLYCWYYNYKFGDDNSEHVISSYQNYFLKGFRTSHTTTDCVNKFKAELKKYLK